MSEEGDAITEAIRVRNYQKATHLLMMQVARLTDELTQATALLNYQHDEIQTLRSERGMSSEAQ